MSKPKKLIVRNREPKDIPAIVECHKAAYSDYPPGSQYDEHIYTMQLNAFPQEQFLAEIDGKVAGYATTIIVQLDVSSNWYTYAKVS